MDKTIKISESTHNLIKKYCDDNNLKISKWIESVIIEKIKEKNVEKSS